MHDIVIRGGTIVDGTGAPGFTGDVAIDGDRIVAVGDKAGPARRDINADGRLVTPGWVGFQACRSSRTEPKPARVPASWSGPAANQEKRR